MRERALSRARLSLACADAGLHYTTHDLARMPMVALDALAEVVRERLEELAEDARKAQAEARKQRRA